jgi:outer membrane receptor protein involved in Fe transport
MDNFWYEVKQKGDPAAVAEPISGDGTGTIVNPKLNFIVTPFNDNNVAKGTNLFLNLGGGFHSNDARVFIQDPDKEIPRYWSGEMGARSRFFDRLDVTLSYWRSYLTSELVFVGDEGTFEPSGASRRHGIESELRYDILPWLTYDLDLSYTWARFVNGDKVPLAPRFLAFSGLTARHDSGLQARFQMRHIGRRYGIEDASFETPTSTIFDLFLKYVWQRYEFFVQFQNLTNKKWRAAEHVFDSRTPGELAAGLPGQLDAHFTPGDPFTVKAGVTIHLW